MRKNKSGKIDKFSDPSDIINNIDWDNLNNVDSFKAGGELVGASNEEVNNACIEETINIINSIKPISQWFVIDGKLVIIFKEELMVYDVEKMNHQLQEFGECHDVLNPEVLLTYKGNHTSVYIELKTDDISVGKYNRGGTIQKQQNSNIMEDIKFNQLPHINTLNVGDEIVIKEEVFTGSLEKPQHVGTRFARCKVVGKGGMEHSFELFVVKSNGANPFHAGSKIIRPMRNVLENGRLLNLSPQPQPPTDAELKFKNGGELNPDNKEVKQYFAHDSGNAGGVLVGKRHSEGGIKAVNNGTGQPIEMEGGEVVITRGAVSNGKKYDFNGTELTTREILSKLNVDGGGVSFAEGGDVPEKMNCGCGKMNFGGSTMTAQEFVHHSETEYQENRLIEGIKKEAKDHYSTLEKLDLGVISIKEALKQIAEKEMTIDSKYPFAD